jgi:hypothetical protein
MRKIVRDLKKEFPTAKISVRRSGHYVLDLGNGIVVIAAATPSDWKSIHNLRADVRRRLRQKPISTQENNHA